MRGATWTLTTVWAGYSKKRWEIEKERKGEGRRRRMRPNEGSCWRELVRKCKVASGLFGRASGSSNYRHGGMS